MSFKAFPLRHIREPTLRESAQVTPLCGERIVAESNFSRTIGGKQFEIKKACLAGSLAS